MKQFQLFPDLCFERDDVAAVEVAVVTVLFADVGAVGDLLGVGFGLEAEMVGAGIGGAATAHIGERAVWVSCALLTVSFCIMFKRERRNEQE